MADDREAQMRQERQETLNPHREGDYLVYGDAEMLPGGRYGAFFWIDHQPEGGPALGRVVEKRRFGANDYSTADLAMIQGISWGQHLVRRGLK